MKIRLGSLLTGLVFVASAAAEESASSGFDMKSLLRKRDEARISRNFDAWLALFSAAGQKREVERARAMLQEAIDDPESRRTWAFLFQVSPGEVLRMTPREFLEEWIRSPLSSFRLPRGPFDSNYKLAEKHGESLATMMLLSAGRRRFEVRCVKSEGAWLIDGENEVEAGDIYPDPETAAKEWCSGIAQGDFVRASLAASRGLRARIGKGESLLKPRSVFPLLLPDPTLHAGGLRDLLQRVQFDVERHARAAEASWETTDRFRGRVVLTSAVAPQLELTCIRQDGAWQVSRDSLIPPKK